MDKKQALLDRWHGAARTSFVPFCTALIKGEKARSGTAIPYQREEALDKESLTALEGIFRESLLNFIVTAGGWRREQVLNGNGFEPLRIWESDFELKFTDKLVQWFICVYNTEWDQASNLKFKEAGDFLLHDFIVTKSLTKARIRAPKRVYDSNRLTCFAAIESVDIDLIKQLLPVLPWLRKSLLDRWQISEKAFWETREQFTFTVKRHTSIISKLAKLNEPHLFHFLCSWYRMITSGGLNAERALLLKFAGDFNRLSQRQEFINIWIDYLMKIEDLHAVYEKSTGCHPVEREPVDNYNIRIWSDLDMNNVRETILSVREDLTPVLNREGEK